jgi:hypothetical protein
MFAITAEQAEACEDATNDDHFRELIEEIEEEWDEADLAEVDKSWDAMHRLLTDGRLEHGNGDEPLRHCVLGPDQLYEGEDYIASLVTPEK